MFRFLEQAIDAELSEPTVFVSAVAKQPDVSSTAPPNLRATNLQEKGDCLVKRHTLSLLKSLIKPVLVKHTTERPSP